jgi:hypothetical protein
MEEIEEEARKLTTRETRRELTAFDAETFVRSMEIQRRSLDRMGDIADRLAEIAMGATFEVTRMNDDGTESTKQIISYHRDSIDAAKVLVRIAKEGLSSAPERLLEKAAADARASV